MDSEPRPSPFVESLVHRTVFTPIRQGSAVAEAVARLGQAIAIGLLRPGDQLPRETKLARSLGISVVTLREALAILREAGLVETRRGRSGGTFVSGSLPRNAAIPPSPLPPDAELRDFSDYRVALEGGAAALAAGARARMAVKLDKGDYIGKEALRRLVDEPLRRSITGIAFEGDAVPDPESVVEHDGEPVGVVTVAVRSAVLDRVLALAVLDGKVSGSVGARVRAGDAEGEVASLPFYDPERARPRA